MTCSFGKDSSSLIFISGLSSRATRIAEDSQPVPPSPVEFEAPSNTLNQLASIVTKPKNAPGAAHLTPKTLSGDSESIYSSRTFNALNLENLRLMCHYFSHAWLTIVSDTEGAVKDTHHFLWHELVPDLAMKHDYLLHALLALSATHLALTAPASSTGPSELASREELARHHQALTLALLRDALASPIGSDTVQPLFACSMLVSLYAFGNFLIPGEDTGTNVLEEFGQAITILHGMTAIVSSDPNLLEDTPFIVARLLKPENPAEPLNPATEEFLVALHAANAAMDWPGGTADAEAYSFMIGVLRYTFRLHCEMPGRQHKVIPFAIRLPERVLAGIREQHGLALCLIAGYAAVLHTLKNNVWIQDWGLRVIKTVERKLAGTEWEKLAAWASRVTSKDPLVL